MTIRQIQVKIGPFKDYEARGTASAINLVTTGADNELNISFTVNKHITGSPNQTAITILNLSSQTRQALQQSGLSIELYAGYVGQPLHLVAKGGVLSVVSQRADANIVTSITVMDGRGATLRSFYDKSFTGATPVADIVRELANTMANQGVSIGEINVKGLLADKGRVFNGRAVDSLDSLAKAFKFSWSIQDGVFQALDDDTGSRKIYVLDANSNLINVSPLLNGQEQFRVGVDITASLDPRILPGDKVQVTSSVSPELDGTYIVDECQLSGASHDPAWVIQIKSLVRQ